VSDYLGEKNYVRTVFTNTKKSLHIIVYVEALTLVSNVTQDCLYNRDKQTERMKEKRMEKGLTNQNIALRNIS
jgi:hypothetical protein